MPAHSCSPIGVAGIAGFTDEAVCDPAVVAARERVEVFPHPERATGIRTEVTIRLRWGEEIVCDREQRVSATDEELPRQWETLCVKFRELVTPVVGERRWTSSWHGSPVRE